MTFGGTDLGVAAGVTVVAAAGSAPAVAGNSVAALGSPTDIGPVGMEDNQLFLLSKEKKRDCQKWTEAEDNWLVSGVREFGKGQWKQILEKYKEYFQEGRNRFTLRLRYAYLMKTGRIEMAPAIITTNGDGQLITQVCLLLQLPWFFLFLTFPILSNIAYLL